MLGLKHKHLIFQTAWVYLGFGNARSSYPLCNAMPMSHLLPCWRSRPRSDYTWLAERAPMAVRASGMLSAI